MSLHPSLLSSIPEETVRIARAAFPKGNPICGCATPSVPLHRPALRGALPSRRPAGRGAACLGLVTIVQFAEGLSDLAGRRCRAWPHRLEILPGLELTDRASMHRSSGVPQPPHRRRGGAPLLRAAAGAVCGRTLVKARGRQRTDSTHVLAATRSSTASSDRRDAAPRAQHPGEGGPGLAARAGSPRMVRPLRAALRGLPLARRQGGSARPWPRQIGADGRPFWHGAPRGRRTGLAAGSSAVQMLRRVWVQQFHAAPGAHPLANGHGPAARAAADDLAL